MDTAARRRYVFVDWLKVISMLMVVWDHLIAVRYPDMGIVRVAREYVNLPLHLIQDFGALGVSVFLIVSGFLSAHYLEKKLTLRTFLNFFLKIYLSTAIAGIFFYGFNKGVEWIWGATWFSQYDLIQWIKSIFLVDTVMTTASPVNGTLWFMAALLFYRAAVMLASMIPGGKLWVKLAAMETIFVINTLAVRALGLSEQWEFIQSRIPYGHIIMIGVLLKIYDAGKMNPMQAFIWQTVNATLLMFAFDAVNIENGYLVSTAYAVLMVVGFKALDPSMKEGGLIQRISAASFTVYLLHATVGALLQTLFVDCLMKDHRNTAVIAALIVTAGVCAVYHMTIERAYENRWRVILIKK